MRDSRRYGRILLCSKAVLLGLPLAIKEILRSAFSLVRTLSNVCPIGHLNLFSA